MKARYARYLWDGCFLGFNIQVAQRGYKIRMHLFGRHFTLYGGII